MRAGIGLVGRDEELVELSRFLHAPGQGALAIRGDAGVGKTALINDIVDRARREDWRVLRAIGVESERPFTLGGLNQMVVGLRQEWSGLDRHDQDVLAPVFGADPVQAPSPVSLATSLLALLEAASHARPVLLVIDDVHWLDELSATVLCVAGRRACDPRVRIIAAFRPQYGVEFSTAGWIELDLGPLRSADARHIVDRIALSLSVSTRRTILDFAAGNPLALEELPRYADQIDTWTVSLPLTDRLVTVFGGRFGLLDARVRTELLRAALDGTRADMSAEVGSRYTMTDVEQAVEQDLLTVSPLGDIVFRHPLVRAAVIHRASAAERRAAHAHLAELYADSLVRRATHLGAASTLPDQSVADLLEQAAQLSIRRGGATVAVDWLRRASQLCTDPSRRDALRAEAAFVASQASRFDDAQTLTDNDESVAAVLTDAYLALYRDGDVIGTHRRVLRALRDAGTLDDATLVRLVKLLLAISLYSGDAALWVLTDEIVDRLSDRLDVDALLYRDALGDVARRGHTVGARLSAYRDGQTSREPWDVVHVSVSAYFVDRLADFRATVQHLFERDHDRGAVTNAMTMLHLLALDQIGSGDWAAAQRSVHIGVELATTHRNELFRYQFIAYDGFRAACAGDAVHARRCAAEVDAWAGPRRLGMLLGFVRRSAVLVALAEGDYEEAYVAALRITSAGEFRPYSHAAIDVLLDFGVAAVHVHRHDWARAHVAEAERLKLRDISPRLEAVVTAVDAMSAPDSEAGALYVKAVDHPGLQDFPFDRNRIQLSYGMWLRRRRHTAEAREVLALAAEGFDDLGAPPWADRARTELRAAGGGVKHSDALTAQERKVAELASMGLSNKEIASELFLSPRTVGAHLYRIFPKLGVKSRAGLGQALRDVPGR
ncbi:helix-turn-helix transcriptional regulator [Rhodococcoides yunnanense]|uniref:helix-turn-helix transcriptional regulator n=1 Tax=Rhodococcoides yunnanense TaxID=278209 RepID=UPI000A070478|nr:AAA family ATPase [Rhodococcus yunnanensis]